MSISKQSLFGAFLLLLGGIILLFAFTQNPVEENTTASDEQDATEVTIDEQGVMPLPEVDNVTVVDGENLENIAEDITDDGSETISNLATGTAAVAAGAGTAIVSNIVSGDNKANAHKVDANNNKANNDKANNDKANKIIEARRNEAKAKAKAEAKKARKLALEKEKAAKLALKKAREENEAFIANRTQKQTASSSHNYVAKSTQPKAQKPKAQKPKKAYRPKSYKVRKGDGLAKVSKKFGMSVEVLAEANDMNPYDQLLRGQTIKIPSKAQERRLLREAKARAKKLVAERRKQARQKAIAEKQRQAAIRAEKQKQATIEAERQRQERLAQKSKKAKISANQKLIQARAQARQQNAKGVFGVQVALAANQQKANEISKTMRRAGYRVKTSQTTRGVRVMVGPENGKIAALALKDKINSDPKVKVNDSWVLFWR